MLPDQWCQRRIVARREPFLPMRSRLHRLDHERVDADHAVLDQMERRDGCLAGWGLSTSQNALV